MKNIPLLTITVLSSSLVSGCAWLPWNTDSTASSSREVQGRIIPHARIQDGADSAAAFHALGRHLQREGRLDDAERAYRRALDFDPAYTESRNALAVIAARRGDLAQAIALLSSLVTLYPDQAYLLANLGYAHYLNGDYVQAKDNLMRALMIAPDNDSARQKLVLVKEKLGETSGEQDGRQLTDENHRPAKGALDSKDRNTVVKLTDGVYELIRPIPRELTQPYVAQCDFPKTSHREVRPTVAELAPSLSSASTSTSTSNSSKRLRLELVNGNGVNRLATSVRDLISGSQWQVVRVLNHDEFGVPVTRIEYAKHRYDAAQSLADTLGVAAQLRPNYHQGDTQLRVVFGKDFRTTEGLKERMASGLPTLAGTE